MSGLGNWEAITAAEDLGLQKGDSSIYSTALLSRSEGFLEYGLGSLLRFYENPGRLTFTGPTPDIPGPDFPQTLAQRLIYKPQPYLIKDKTYWVVLSPIKIVKNKVTLINQNTAVDRYKRLGLFMGKFSKEQTARKYVASVIEYLNLSAALVVGGDASRQFGPYVTSLNVSYSIDGANQIQFTVIDKDYKIMDNNFFMNRRKIAYRGNPYEIGVVEVGPGPGGSPIVTVTAWDEAVQRMKRDKQPESISGSSVYDYAFNAAEKFGLAFVGEKTNKNQTINKGNGNNSDESVWSVLQSAGNQNEFVLYVMDGVMVYGSQKWLMWKFGTDVKTTVDPKTKKKNSKYYSRLYFNPGQEIPSDAKKFKVMEWPSVRQSENDPLEGDGRVVVEKPNGCIIRPGHTVIIGPKPKMFQGGYIVTEVSFTEATNDPVEISFRTPEKPQKQTGNP